MDFLQISLFLTFILHCNGHLDLDANPRQYKGVRKMNSRRFSNPHEPSVIIGAPLHPYHLPPAEPILPGHTLIRPAIGMLKSSVKFPHREQENGSGVYGHIDNLGIKFDGKNERVLYTGFRRSLPNSSINELVKAMKKRKNQQRRHYEYLPQSKLHHLSNSHYTGDKINKLPPNIFEVPISHNINKKPVKRHDAKLKKLNRFRAQKGLNQEAIPLGKIIATETMDVENLIDFFRAIQSLRRLEASYEDTQQAEPLPATDLKYVPGNNSFGFSSPFDSDEEVGNKTVQFWNTKDAFNHVKFNPEAPDQTELLPADPNEKTRNWWFYHQSDFEEFAER